MLGRQPPTARAAQSPACNLFVGGMIHEQYLYELMPTNLSPPANPKFSRNSGDIKLRNQDWSLDAQANGPEEPAVLRKVPVFPSPSQGALAAIHWYSSLGFPPGAPATSSGQRNPSTNHHMGFRAADLPQTYAQKKQFPIYTIPSQVAYTIFVIS